MDKKEITDVYLESDMLHLQVVGFLKTVYPNQSSKLCAHPFSEVIFCRNTCGAEYLAGTHRYPIQEGDVLCIPPGMSHCALMPTDAAQPLQLDCLWISHDFQRSIGRKYSYDVMVQRPAPMPIPTKGTRFEAIGHYFSEITKESEKRDFCWEEIVKGNAYIIAAMICRAFQDEQLPQIESAQPDLLDQVLDYIAAHLRQKITLASTAQAFFVSESTIKRLFQKQMGISFYRYITQYRLAAAQALMLEGMPMEQIAARVGFGDYPSFYRAFKQEYGLSPRQYRKRNAPGEP